MEIKATLNKPYTEQQRMNFIVENNHQQGYEIREAETELQAWGYTEEEKQEQEKQRRNNEIDQKISELNEMCLPEIINGNTENIELYKQVITGLEQARL